METKERKTYREKCACRKTYSLGKVTKKAVCLIRDGSCTDKCKCTHMRKYDEGLI